MTVARLFFLDPPKYGRTCAECVRFVFDEDTGRRADDKTRRHPLTLAPVPLERGKTDPPCHACPKTIGLEVRSRHWRELARLGRGDPPDWCYRAFRHWQRCAAVAWRVADADDPIVGRNADLFAGVREGAERGRNEGLLAALGLLKGR